MIPNSSTARTRLSGRLARVACACVLAGGLTLGLAASSQAATLSVNCDTGGDLQARINAATSGDTILVKGTCVGNFQITGKSLTIKGNPTATLDGNDVFTTLSINAPGKSVHLRGLTVTGGAASFGAGITKTAGRLILNRVRVTGNVAADTAGTPGGGGILSGAGPVTLIDSTVKGNRAVATDTAQSATGGGLFVNDGNLTVKNSVISGNRATASPAAGASTAGGGGFYLESGNLVLRGSNVLGNRVTASSPGNAAAHGAAGSQNSGSKADISASLVKANVSTASSTAGASDAGETLSLAASPATVRDSRILANTATATSSLRADVEGGGLFTSYGLALVRSTVDGNRLHATSSGSGGALAEGGGVMTGTPTKLIASTLSRNQVSAQTSSAAQANAWGGGGYVTDLKATNSTIALNTVKATATGVGGTTYADGGGLDATGCCSIVNSTVARNGISTSGATSYGEDGGGLYSSSGVTLEATIVANNTAPTGADCAGGPESSGHNLIRKPLGCSFTKKNTDKVGKDPKLGVLQDNGGPTQTMTLAPASPAGDVVAKAACAVAEDQRGVHRPQGPRCDIGAYERKAR
jgi:fibronectin-binding autotransporter adhesin